MSDEHLPLVSVIFPAKNEGNNVRTTLESLRAAKSRYPYEIIVVDDGSTDNCCAFLQTEEENGRVKLITTPGIGAAAARNLGAEHAKGTYLIFCDAHLTFPHYWIDGLVDLIKSGRTDAVSPAIASMHEPHKIGYGQTLDQRLGVVWTRHVNRPEPSAILPGGCLAVPQKVFLDIGGFDRGFRVWGFEDIEISIKLWLFGYRCLVQPSVKILHLFRKAHPYKVEFDHVYYNMLRMAYSHFSEPRIAACKKLIIHADPDRIEREVLQGGAAAQRLRYFARRKYDDDWFMRQFAIPF
ncbi:glycosyltransferase [Brevibacillus thermoruber]|jgi:glycosyltransferase involved in cell wall biosynthesis|uniref:glycosyltransferase n=1 Tax=Brevibacillus thermoruber TaxID=33942 RepID=UPI00054FE123|nr:glycosyltransferase [Brevibacillus thermoruber]